MAILITEDGAVRYVNENDVNRTMFPNLTGAMGDEQYDALNGRLVVVEGKVSNLEDCCNNVNNEITQLSEDLSEKASLISDTASGAIASFPDGAEGNASEVVVSIEPVQDLHGQTAPYPAGGGKNKFDIDKMVNTQYITVSNGVITVVGNSKNSGKKLSELADLIVGETYTLTATSTTSDNIVYLYGTGANVSWTFGTQKNNNPRYA